MPTTLGSPASQIGFAVEDLDKAIEGWERLGVGPWQTTRGVELDDFAYRCRPSRPSVDIGWARLGNVRLELVRPGDDEPSSYRDAVKRGVTALHNLSWFVDDLDTAVAATEDRDAVVLQSGSRSGSRFASFGPTGGNGTIVELVETSGVEPKSSTSERASPRRAPFAAPMDQLGFAVADLEKAIHGWLQVGVGPWLTLKGAKLGGYEYRGQRSSPKLDVGFTQLGSVQLEVIQPTDDEQSSYRDFLTRGGRGLQHLGWFVDDLDEAVEAAKEQGGAILQTGSWSGVRFAYFEPAAGDGTITELIGMTDLSREMFALIREKASVAEWDGRSHPSRNVLRAADWGLRWHAVRAQVSDMLHRD